MKTVTISFAPFFYIVGVILIGISPYYNTDLVPQEQTMYSLIIFGIGTIFYSFFIGFHEK